VVDAAMNDLIRPALYDAYHEILPVTRATGRCDRVRHRRARCAKPATFLASDRKLAVVEGDLLAIMAAAHTA
jgi:diaminopimelate decarboxylase